MNEWWVWKADWPTGPPIDGILHLTYAMSSMRRPTMTNCGIRIARDLSGSIFINKWWVANIKHARMENLKDCQPCLECVDARP